MACFVSMDNLLLRDKILGFFHGLFQSSTDCFSTLDMVQILLERREVKELI
jgi:hypothetical protein